LRGPVRLNARHTAHSCQVPITVLCRGLRVGNPRSLRACKNGGAPGSRDCFLYTDGRPSMEALDRGWRRVPLRELSVPSPSSTGGVASRRPTLPSSELMTLPSVRRSRRFFFRRQACGGGCCGFRNGLPTPGESGGLVRCGSSTTASTPCTAAFVQIAVVTAALSRGQEWKVLITGFAGLLSAGAWAQWAEASSRLRRPFGFYGGLIGVALACLLFKERWILLAAHCLGAPWMQAIGRFRCLVNGCCHGGPAPSKLGICVTHERSRVTRLTGFAGLAIHPTQLYSILGSAFLGLVLWRLWSSSCPVSLICGVYGMECN
jgi:hypothetical protein